VDVADGKAVWESEMLDTTDNGRSRCSSVLVVDGMAVVCTKKNLVGLDAETGKVAWRQKDVRSESASAAAWVTEAKTKIVCAGAGKMTCMDLKTGAPVWTTTCASDSTPAIAGEYMAYVGGNEKAGLRAHKLSAEKAEELWNVPMKDIYTSPVIYEGYVYAVGEKGRALCVELASGKVAWEEKITEGDGDKSSPVAADGKLIVVAGPWLYVIKATPEKFTVLAKVDVGALKWTSPAIVDGRVFLRTASAVVCYDLRKQ
jgi:outer membrane protein assembly factor BamB